MDFRSIGGTTDMARALVHYVHTQWVRFRQITVH